MENEGLHATFAAASKRYVDDVRIRMNALNDRIKAKDAEIARLNAELSAAKLQIAQMRIDQDYPIHFEPDFDVDGD
jgi:multidrug resistance efflux pump